jgi:sortase A
VGGESTHCVMSAHRGLPSARLFTDLDRLEMGDTFQITVLDRVLTYMVDQVKVITPREIDDLQIVEGQDYCTLITCYPTGVNSHRLLVQGARIPYEEAEVIEETVQAQTVPESRWEEQYLLGIVLGVLGMLAAALICCAIMVCRKYRKGGRNAREKEPQSR